MKNSEQKEEHLLGRYCVLHMAGEGGESKVYICWDPTVQRRVAIKILPLTNRDNQGGIPGLAEARTAALLKHPCIVSLLDFKEDQDSAYVIMESVEGPSLRKLMESLDDDLLDMDVITHITQGVASALDYAHENGVLHLDIKPDNVLIEMNGQIKVADFGVSELADAQGFGQAYGGTIGYMPPEQIAGQDLDQRADVFAFAVLIYEMLTGERPYAARNLNQALDVFNSRNIKPPSYYRDDVGPQLDEAIMNAMSPLKQERPETIVDFVSELEQCMGNPKVGLRELRQLISDEEEEDDEQEYREADGVWGNLSPKAHSALKRGLSCLMSWWVGYLAASCFGLGSTLMTIGFGAIPGIIALFVPSVGPLVSLVGLGVGLIYSPNVILPVGLILIIVSVFWWLLFGRRDGGACCLALSAAPLGLVFATPLIPLLSGFFLGPRRGLTTAVMMSFLSLSLAIAAGSDSLIHYGIAIATTAQPDAFYDFYANAATWITVASWVLSAFVMGLFCMGRDRILSILGAFLNGCILVGVQILLQWIQTDQWGAPSFIWIATSVGAVLCIVVLSILGAPDYRRGER